jgi:photosystem II stability/assembly factor-like uncharacterized protein
LTESICTLLRPFRLSGLLVVMLVSTLHAQVKLQTWERLLDVPSPVWTVHFLDLDGPPRIGYVGCNEAVYRTTDGGNTWTRCTVNAPEFTAADFSFKDSLTGWFANYNYNTSKVLPMCYKTTDGGLTWNPIYGPTNYCSSVLYRPQNHLLLLASWKEQFVPQSGFSCYSTDEGLTWNVFWRDQRVNGFAFADSAFGVATSAGLVFIRTTDGGLTWSNSNATGDESWQPAAIPKTRTYYASSEASDYFFDSKDLGLTYTQRQKLGTTTGTVRQSSCGSLYAQFSNGSAYRAQGVIRSQDGGTSWFPIHGPVNKTDTRFYVRGGYVFAGSVDTITNTFSVWRYVEDSTFYDGGEFDQPQVSDSVLYLVSPDCGTLDSTLSIVYLNDCANAELIDAKIGVPVQGDASRFGLALRDTLPVRISGTYKIPILYSPVGHDGDTTTLTLTYRTHGKDITAIVKIIGEVPGTHTIARFVLQSNGSSTASSYPGDRVPIDLMLLNEIKDSLGVDSISFELTYDEDVATPLDLAINPPWSLLRASQSFGKYDLAFRRTAGEDVPANSIVASFGFKSFLSLNSETAITATNFRLNDGDSIYYGCTATATDPGSVAYSVLDTCGDIVLRQYMRGEPVIRVLLDKITIESPVEEPASLLYYNLLGEQVARQEIELTRHTIAAMPVLPQGVYFATLERRNGVRRSVRFVH